MCMHTSIHYMWRAAVKCHIDLPFNSETMHKTALLNLDSRPKAGIHKFDVSNAHQEYERAATAEAVAYTNPGTLTLGRGRAVHAHVPLLHRPQRRRDATNKGPGR